MGKHRYDLPEYEDVVGRLESQMSRHLDGRHVAWLWTFPNQNFHAFVSDLEWRSDRGLPATIVILIGFGIPAAVVLGPTCLRIVQEVFRKCRSISWKAKKPPPAEVHGEVVPPSQVGHEDPDDREIQVPSANFQFVHV